MPEVSALKKTRPVQKVFMPYRIREPRAVSTFLPDLSKGAHKTHSPLTQTYKLNLQIVIFGWFTLFFKRKRGRKILRKVLFPSLLKHIGLNYFIDAAIRPQNASNFNDELLSVDQQ